MLLTQFCFVCRGGNAGCRCMQGTSLNLNHNTLNVAFIVYDITKKSTLESVEKRWLSQLKQHTHPSIVLCLLGNKSDNREGRQVHHGLRAVGCNRAHKKKKKKNRFHTTKERPSQIVITCCSSRSVPKMPPTSTSPLSR